MAHLPMGMGSRLVYKPGDWHLEVLVKRVSKGRKLPNGWIQVHRKALGGQARLRSLGFWFSFPPMDIDSGLEYLSHYAYRGRPVRLRRGDVIIPGFLFTREQEEALGGRC